MTTASIVNVGHIRSQLTAIDKNAERAFDRAFDLQQAGAPAERVEAALAEINRLQESARRLRQQLGEQAVLH
jgi:HAMP domain-containing protein